jgi:hypothetical protein
MGNWLLRARIGYGFHVASQSGIGIDPRLPSRFDAIPKPCLSGGNCRYRQPLALTGSILPDESFYNIKMIICNPIDVFEQEII